MGRVVTTEAEGDEGFVGGPRRQARVALDGSRGAGTGREDGVCRQRTQRGQRHGAAAVLGRGGDPGFVAGQGWTDSPARKGKETDGGRGGGQRRRRRFAPPDGDFGRDETVG